MYCRVFGNERLLSFPFLERFFMKIVGINGSPRKSWNSATVLDCALKGASSSGAEVHRIDLFDLSFCGCVSCFACKRLGGSSYSRCVQQDELTSVLEEILQSDGLIIAAPIYYGEVPGTVRNLYERLLFPPNHYMKDYDEGYGKRIPVGLIYTMNASDPAGNHDTIARDQISFQRFIGDTAVLNVLNCLQFDDYSKYASERFDIEKKKQDRVTVFPVYCQQAFDMGKNLVRK